MFDPHYRGLAVAMWCQVTSCSTGAYCLFHMLVSLVATTREHNGLLQGGGHV